MKKCPYCAEEIKDDAIYCRYCKHDLTNPNVPTRNDIKAVSQTEPPPVTVPPLQIPATQKLSKKKLTSRPIFWIAIVLVFLFLVGLFCKMSISRSLASGIHSTGTSLTEMGTGKTAFTNEFNPYSSTQEYVNITLATFNGWSRKTIKTDWTEVNGLKWSPDGKWLLAWGVSDSGCEVKKISAKGNESTDFHLDDCVDIAAWSPDGSKIVYTSYTQSLLGAIRIINADTGAEIYFYDSEYGIGDMDWSASGDQIYVMGNYVSFIDRRDSGYQLYETGDDYSFVWNYANNSVEQIQANGYISPNTRYTALDKYEILKGSMTENSVCTTTIQLTEISTLTTSTIYNGPEEGLSCMVNYRSFDWTKDSQWVYFTFAGDAYAVNINDPSKVIRWYDIGDGFAIYLE